MNQRRDCDSWVINGALDGVSLTEHNVFVDLSMSFSSLFGNSYDSPFG